MRVEVEAVGEVTGELVEAVERLLPQLTAAPPLEAADLAGIVGHQANTVLVARGDGSVVGMLVLVVVPLASGVRARIEDVVVDQAARGQGVGSALTAAALRLARERGARTVDLTSRPERAAANRLYQRLGFQPHDTNSYRYQLGPPAT
jgi:ribosomal protein S18 acetylase RimI-like enzyme